MIKIVLAGLCLFLSAATLQAGSLDDLKAAQAAAEKGTADEAIRLFTSGIGAGDLTGADQVAAHKGRAAEYTAKSMIADAFVRLDQARTMRDNAIADLTVALKVKADDATLYVARGEAYHLNGQYDPAIADFDAALKLNSAAVTLVQRAVSLRAKGDTERAVADLTAVLELDFKAAGLEAWDIYNERGYAHFLGARYAAAAADFEKSMALGANAHTGDVLWLPYQVAWLHIARARAGQNDTEELLRNAEKIDLKQWPGTLVAFYRGETKLDQLSLPSNHSAMGSGRECNLSFFTAQQALIKNDKTEAARLLKRAHAVCNIHAVIYLAARAELQRLAK